MRTTLDISDDVLQAAKELAARENKTAGYVISELARRALNGTTAGPPKGKPEEFFGFRPFPKRGALVTNETINKLRDDDAY